MTAYHAALIYITLGAITFLIVAYQLAKAPKNTVPPEGAMVLICFSILIWPIVWLIWAVNTILPADEWE